MKRILSVIISCVLLVTMLSVGVLAQKSDNNGQVKPSLPSYEKLDPELVKDNNVKGKELHADNGKAYFKPAALDNLEPKDVKGKKKGIAILVDFPVSNGNISDVPGVNYEQIPADKFDDLLNGTEYNPYELDIFESLAEYNGISAPTDRTLRNYYEEVSYGQFEIDVDVVGWYELPNSYDYYLGQDKGHYNENGDAYVAELVMDAIRAADNAGVDFSEYAVDAQPGDFDVLDIQEDYIEQDGETYDQIVPNIFIIHRGTGAEYSADPSIIWSHKWDVLSASYFGEYYKTGQYPDDSELKFEIIDGVVVNTYNIVPEVGQDLTGYYAPEPRDPSPAYPGVYAHEFGHVLGLPDQYDYGYDSEGTGMFTLMAGGSYGRNIPNRWYSGNTPVHMDAWSKYYLGFAEPIEVKPDDEKQTLTLMPVTVTPDIYKIVVPGSDGREYFLLENRQQTGYDAGLEYNVDGEDLHGLVVYHVDEDVFMRNFHRPNEAANWDWNNRGANFKDKKTGENHYAIGVVQADGNYDMEKYNNDGDAGDVFPGKLGVTELRPEAKASPNTLSYYVWGIDNRGETGITIENIVENEDGSVSFDIYLAE